VQPEKVPLSDQNDRLRAFARGDGAAVIGDRLFAAATSGSLRNRFECQVGRIADNRFDVVETDFRFSQGVECQLFNFGARQGAVGAEARNQ